MILARTSSSLVRLSPPSFLSFHHFHLACTHTSQVPGLADDPSNNVKRGKFKIASSILKTEIFDPVVTEVLTLVLGQISATKAANLPVKAVLLVGGFGQSPYLRERIRAALPTTTLPIEVMQPPNGWTAVVRGALMKGLSTLSPATERVKVAARVARKHYGTEIMSKYDSARGHRRNTAWWDDYDGELKVFDMSWFINKGSEVTEDIPYVRKYHKVWKVADGPRQTVAQDILMYADPTDTGAPIYKDSSDLGEAGVCHGANYTTAGGMEVGVKHLARLKADLSCIPQSELMQRVGRDGKMYYVVYYEIEMTYLSAHTRYALVYKGVRYDSVSAEYV